MPRKLFLPSVQNASKVRGLGLDSCLRSFWNLSFVSIRLSYWSMVCHDLGFRLVTTSFHSRLLIAICKFLQMINFDQAFRRVWFLHCAENLVWTSNFIPNTMFYKVYQLHLFLCSSLRDWPLMSTVLRVKIEVGVLFWLPRIVFIFFYKACIIVHYVTLQCILMSA